MTEVSEIGIVALETAETSAAAVFVVEQPAAVSVVVAGFEYIADVVDVVQIAAAVAEDQIAAVAAVK